MLPAPHSAAHDLVSDSIAGYFCRVADTVGLPRSAAMIYHVLFVSPEPLSFTEVVANSGLSKASASTGLKLLERIRAAEIVVVPGERGTYYRPELSMRRLATGFLRQSLLPGLEAGGRILEAAAAVPENEIEPHLAERLSSVRRWHELTADLIPALSAMEELDG